jgi:AAA domain
MDVLREVLLPKLEGIRPSGGSWMARCPAHEDGRASLSITRGKDHPVILNCKAGCETIDVLAAIGLTWETLCAPREDQDERRPAGEWTAHGPAVAIYDYTDENGKLLFQVLRTAGKDFPQRRPDPASRSGWRWQLGDTRRVLYRLPKVIEAVKGGCIIWICEGEKDVHALEAAGEVATCNPGGAGKWRPEFAEFFTDAIVRVVADADAPGQAHARRVAESLEPVAAAVEIVEAAEGKDAADHFAAGRTVRDFVVTKEAAARAEPELAPDLYEFIGEEDPPYEWVIPELLEREDRLIFTGEEGRGKSMAVRQMAVAAAAGIHPFTDVIFPPVKVLVIDCENPRRKSRRHFRNLEEVARNKFRPVPRGGLRLIHRPESINLGSEDDTAWLLERVTAHKPDLLVIGPLYKLHALDINEEQAARGIVRVIDAVRNRADCAVIVEAHAPHGTGETRHMRPFGSSLFLRWPEFGYGIRMAKPEPGQKRTRKIVDVVPWRGPRDERNWPRQLKWGEPHIDWPWVPVLDSPHLSVVDGGA